MNHGSSMQRTIISGVLFSVRPQEVHGLDGTAFSDVHFHAHAVVTPPRVRSVFDTNVD